MSIQEICRVEEQTRLGEGLYKMVLNAPKIVGLTQCGQFVHIACGEGHLLRRPGHAADSAAASIPLHLYAGFRFLRYLRRKRGPAAQRRFPAGGNRAAG